MSDSFERTKETATAAAVNAALLRRAADRARGLDRDRLLALSLRYADYAEALLETIGEAAASPSDDQVPLL